MIRLPEYGFPSEDDGRKYETLTTHQILEVEGDQLPAYDIHSKPKQDHHLLDHVPLLATTTPHD